MTQVVVLKLGFNLTLVFFVHKGPGPYNLLCFYSKISIYNKCNKNKISEIRI